MKVGGIDEVGTRNGYEYEMNLKETTLELFKETIILKVGTITDLKPSGMTYWKLSFGGVDIDCRKSLKKKIYSAVLSAPERENQRKKDDLKTFLR